MTWPLARDTLLVWISELVKIMVTHDMSTMVNLVGRDVVSKVSVVTHGVSHIVSKVSVVTHGVRHMVPKASVVTHGVNHIEVLPGFIK